MTIAQAIEILKQASHDHIDIDDMDIRDALILGREALQFCQHLKAVANDQHIRLLPSETIESPPE